MLISSHYTSQTASHLSIKPYLLCLGISFFGYNVLKGKALHDRLGEMSADEYYRSAAHIVAGMYDHSTMEEYQLTKRVRALANAMPYSIDCTCYGNQIVIQADGQVTNCPFLRVEQGQVQTLTLGFEVSSTDAVLKWRKKVPWLKEGGLTGEGMNFLYSGGCTFGTNELSGNQCTVDTGAEIFNSEIMHAIIQKQLPDEICAQIVLGTLTHWHHRRIGTL